MIKNDHIKALNIIQFNIILPVIRTPFLRHSYVFVCHSCVICISLVGHRYVTRKSSVCYSYVTHMYAYFIRMSLVCTRMSSVCHPYVLVCHSHVTCMYQHMYSYVTRISFVCIRMSPVCHSYVLVCHSYVSRLWFYHPIRDSVLRENPVPANVQPLKKLATISLKFLGRRVFYRCY